MVRKSDEDLSIGARLCKDSENSSNNYSKYASLFPQVGMVENNRDGIYLQDYEGL